MEIRQTGNVDVKWIQIAKEVAERTLKFMNCTETPAIHIIEGYDMNPTPGFGYRSIGSGYNLKTKEVSVSIQWLTEKASQLPAIRQHDTAEEIMRFNIPHEVCHYVQDIKGHHPPPEESAGLAVTDIDRYNKLPHEYEANIVGIEMSTGILVPNITPNVIIQYLKRDPQLRGTGFSLD